MPLPPPVDREPIHTRRIHFNGYERKDGLFDIEAYLTDTKSYEFSNSWRGSIRPGEALHEMLLRVTVDEEMTIHDVEAATENSPFALCPDITPNYKRLIGVRIGPGWRKEVRSRVGGIEGCTHITELLYPLATVAVQTIRPLKNHRRKKVDSETRQDRGRPFVLNTCHAWAESSPVVKENAPDYYRPPSVIASDSETGEAPE